LTDLVGAVTDRPPTSDDECRERAINDRPYILFRMKTHEFGIYCAYCGQASIAVKVLGSGKLLTDLVGAVTDRPPTLDEERGKRAIDDRPYILFWRKTYQF